MFIRSLSVTEIECKYLWNVLMREKITVVVVRSSLCPLLLFVSLLFVLAGVASHGMGWDGIETGTRRESEQQ